MNERRRYGDDLTGRRNGYQELRKELHWFFRKIWLVIIVIGVTSTLGLVGYGFALHDIQEQRLSWCEEQNGQHDAAESALMAGAGEDIENAPTEAAKAEIRRRRDVTLALVNAVNPRIDCNSVVETGLKSYLPW